MIEHLAALVETFPGAANQTRCFAHILNLVAKSVLRQFEGPKKGKGKVAGDAAKELAGVVDEMDVDNDEASDSGSNEGGNECDDDGDDDDDDDDEDELPEEDEMSVEEMCSLKESVKPIRLVLTKVSQFQQTTTTSTINNSLQLRGLSLAIKNSSTIVLPRWYEVLDNLALKRRMMPRDVSTRWNSTYDMVEFAIEYQAALDTMTADRGMNLRKFELSKKEWSMATELSEVLQVRFNVSFSLMN
jgi:hypothetical protein